MSAKRLARGRDFALDKHELPVFRAPNDIDAPEEKAAGLLRATRNLRPTQPWSLQLGAGRSTGRQSSRLELT